MPKLKLHFKSSSSFLAISVYCFLGYLVSVLGTLIKGILCLVQSFFVTIVVKWDDNDNLVGQVLVTFQESKLKLIKKFLFLELSTFWDHFIIL